MNLRIVQVTGGLGNQMFQYEFGKYIEKRFSDDIIKYDLDYFNANNAIREYGLENAFGIKVEQASAKEIRRVRGFNPYDNKFKKIVSAFSRKNTDASFVIEEDLDRMFDDGCVESDVDTYYSGYWQNERVFKSFREEVLRDYRVTDGFTDGLKDLLREVENENAVAVHVRLEDYLQDSNFKIYGDICTKKYYESAIKYITDNVNNPVFYLFCTDFVGAHEYMPNGIEYKPVSYEGQRDYLDMYLMSRCKHNIIANSTFSWWGAWLNRNSDKIVICPNRWLNNHDVYNQYCDGWIRI